ncbi:MAG: hypothetical protein IJ841_08545 [Prevotella sp.]|nr:hypothetical protein [Prevotella sp.]MBR1933716.1 hypothetical protein [Prevotella sp.]
MEKIQRLLESEGNKSRDDGKYNRVGLERGIEKGMAEGLEKGRAKERTELAKKMKADGLPAELIAKYTGLIV